MTPLAEPADVTALTTETYTGAAEVQVRTLIRLVSGRIRAHLPDIDTWITDGLLDPTMVRDFVAEVTIRARTALDAGLGVISETHPEYSYRLSEAVSTSLNSITADEWSLLTPQSKRARRAFSIQPG